MAFSLSSPRSATNVSTARSTPPAAYHVADPRVADALDTIASAADPARPDKAPTWLYEAETYGLWYSDLASEEEIRTYQAFSFIDWGQPCVQSEMGP